MPKSEALREVNELDTPLLFFKVGVLGCAPLDMPRKLAGEYDAQFYASETIRKSLIDDRDAQGMDPVKAQKINTRQIKSIIEAKAEPDLLAREDVVADAFFITEKSRILPLELAKRTGALTVALWINTQYSIAIERTETWAQEGSFIVPVDRWGIPPVQAVKTMMKQIQRPSDEEGLNYIFNLDGDGDTDDILDQFDELLDRSGLADRYEYVED